MNPNLEKGNELERAVKLIESQILQTNPNLKNNPFIIENKKTVIIDEIRHEIDLYIEIDLGNGYKSIFVFEYKNWNNSVGKNEIIVFSEIIRATQATKGYFIAKEFGKYAVAQANKDSRIQLLKATDELVELVHFPHFHCITLILLAVRVEFNSGNPNMPLQDITVDSVYLNGESIDFNLFAENLGKQVMHNRINNEPTALLPDGEYNYEAENIFNYNPSVLLVNGKPCEEVVVKIKFLTFVQKPRIISRFNIEKRGRVIEYENLNLPIHKQISFQFIYLHKE
jgi:hypothetical protein